MILGLGACMAWVAILALSDRDPTAGPWPPRQGTAMAAAWAWGLTILIYVGLFQVWSEPWNPLGWPAWVRWGLGTVLGLAGTVLQTWGMVDLGLKGTSGWDVGVVTRGSYRLCRHPQYLGQAIGFVGLAAISANAASMTVALAAVATLVYGSRVEDRAMAARHPGFAAYTRTTPFLIPARRP